MQAAVQVEGHTVLCHAPIYQQEMPCILLNRLKIIALFCPACFQQEMLSILVHRLKIIAPTQPPPRQEHEVVGVGAVPGLQQGAVQLVEAALDPRLLCKMDPTWHPWL